MFTGYSTVSSVVVLWLMLGYFYFFYLIRIVAFSTRYRCLGCCTVFLQFLLLWRISLFCPLFFHSLWWSLRSQHGGQKQYRTKYRTVSTPRRRYTHPRCRTSPTTRNEKTANKTTKYVTTTKTAGKPCKNPDSDIGWKTQLSLSNRKTEVPQHQPQYDNGTDSWISGER